MCRRQDASAKAAREEAIRFAKETRDSVKREAQEVMDELDAAREALEEAVGGELAEADGAVELAAALAV